MSKNEDFKLYMFKYLTFGNVDFGTFTQVRIKSVYSVSPGNNDKQSVLHLMLSWCSLILYECFKAIILIQSQLTAINTAIHLALM